VACAFVRVCACVPRGWARALPTSPSLTPTLTLSVSVCLNARTDARVGDGRGIGAGGQALARRRGGGVGGRVARVAHASDGQRCEAGRRGRPRGQAIAVALARDLCRHTHPVSHAHTPTNREMREREIHAYRQREREREIHTHCLTPTLADLSLTHKQTHTCVCLNQRVCVRVQAPVVALHWPSPVVALNTHVRRGLPV
jgi:hypothetical protein